MLTTIISLGLNAAFAVTVVIGLLGVVIFFFVLNEPAPLGSEQATARRKSDKAGEEIITSAESAAWVNTLLIRFAATIVLGGGSTDGAVWSDHLCRLVDKKLNQVSATLSEKAGPPPAVHQQNSEGSFPPSANSRLDGLGRQSSTPSLVQTTSIRLESLSLGDALEGPLDDSSFEGGGMCRTCAKLPCIGKAGIQSHVRRDGATELRLPLEYRDGRFQMNLRCVLPLAFGLGNIGIPADLLTVKSRVAIRGISFSSLLSITMKDAEIDIQFPTMPEWDARFDTTIGRKREVQGGSKVQEILSLAIRRAMSKLVAPNCLRATIMPQPPYIQWSTVSGGSSTDTTPR